METVEGITVNIYTTKRTVTIVGTGAEVARVIAMTINEINDVDGYVNEVTDNTLTP